MINPEILSIEFNTTCQLKCPRCPTTSSGQDDLVGKGHLKLSDLKTLIEGNRQVKLILAKSYGEALLNPEYLSIIEFCFNNRVRINGNSGVNLNDALDDVLEGMVKYRVQSLVVSIDGATPGTYSRYRVGGDLNKVIRNIRKINSFKKEYRSVYPKLIWQMILFGHNEHEVEIARKMANKLGMGFYVKMSWDETFSPINDKEYAKKLFNCPASNRKEFEIIRKKSYYRKCCNTLWMHPKINWDGRVWGCDVNQWDDFGGNAFKDGYLPAVNGEKISYARRMLLGEVPPREDIPCFNCRAYQMMVEHKNYLTLDEFDLPWRVWGGISHSIYYRSAFDVMFKTLYRFSGIGQIRALYHQWRREAIADRISSGRLQ